MHHLNNTCARKRAHGTFLQLNTYVGKNSKAIQRSWKLIKLIEQKKSDEKQKKICLFQAHANNVCPNLLSPTTKKTWEEISIQKRMHFETLTPIQTSQQLKHNTYKKNTKKTQQKGAMLKMTFSTYSNKKIKEESKKNLK